MKKLNVEQKAKLGWIGKMVFIGLVIAFLGSMLLELGIYSVADKVASAYTQDLK